MMTIHRDSVRVAWLPAGVGRMDAAVKPTGMYSRRPAGGQATLAPTPLEQQE